LCCLVAACNQSQQGIGETVKLAIFGTPDVQLTAEQVHEIPYASIYAKVNGESQILLVLAYAENGNLKWVTRDKAMLITRNGRLVKTLGLPDNLLDVTEQDSDPLIHAQRIVDGTQWTRIQSWTEGKQLRTATLSSRFSLAGVETVTVLNVPHVYRVLDEDISVAQLNIHYHNRFWIEPDTGAVRKTEQYIGPGYFPIETTTVTPYKP